MVSTVDARYDRYAEMWDNPVTTESIELGNRALHWLFMENFAPYVALGTIGQHAAEAHDIAARREGRIMDTGETTIVIFRKWHTRADGHGVIALFPALPDGRRGMCDSFEHVGQHGAADLRGVIARTKPARPAEYADLKRELESAPYGYVLDVRQRTPRGL
jgi:hypothetical protein